MASKGADGKVIIDVTLGLDAFKKSVLGLKKTLGGIASIVGVAFAGKSLIDFTKQALELGSSVSEVQNVVDTAFGDMSYKMEEFAKSSIRQYGMSQLAAKKTASTYMAMARGMQIPADAASSMALSLTALSGDVASFFNISQELADIKLKSVFTGETETLKDLGVVMTQTNLKAFALRNGMNANIESMSQAELVSLRYQFVMEQLALAHGDFAKTQGSWANQTRILSMQWEEFMSVIGQGVINVLTPALRALNSMIAVLIQWAQAFSNVTAAIFGKQEAAAKSSASAIGAIGTSSADAAKGQEDLANATKKAAKEAKGALAPYDQLNILQTQAAENGSSGDTSSVVTPNFSGSGFSGEIGKDVRISPELQKVMDFIEKFAQKLRDGISQIDTMRLKESLDNLKNSVAPFAKNVGQGLFWFLDNVLIPLSAWIANEAVPAFLDVLAGAIDFLNSVIEIFEPYALWLWDNFLEPIAKWTGGIIIDVLGGIADALTRVSDWMMNHQGTVMTTTGIVAGFFAAWEVTKILSFIQQSGGLFGVLQQVASKIKLLTLAKLKDKIETAALNVMYAKDFVVSLAKSAAALAKQAVQWGIETAAKAASTVATWAHQAATTAATAATWLFNAAMTVLTSPITLVVAAIGALIAIIVLLVKNWDDVKRFASEVWERVKEVWNKAGDWFRNNVTDPVKNFFAGMWDGIKSAFTKAFDFIKKSFKNYVNGWISMLESFINFFINGINVLIRGVNKISFKVPEWVPGIGGNQVGFNIPQVAKIKLPKLAQGAVIPPNREFMAVLGDQKNGTNLEAPEGLIRKIFREELGNDVGGGDWHIYIMMPDGTITGETIISAAQRLNQRSGRTVIAVEG